ncbi:MAG: hypothetical protein GPJ52_09990, partial [Candidatus Heimdallarchaeota archaeon]|nr:hypothetical protein [Candidatus Heimdallarchaeota archaeon]
MVDYSKKIAIKKIKKLDDGLQVSLGGWAEHLVHKGKICFLTVRDSSGKIQVTGIKTKVPEELWDVLIGLKNETIVWITGKVKKNEQAPGGIEILPEEVLVLNKVQGPVPVDI